MVESVDKQSFEYFSDINYVLAAASHATSHAAERLSLIAKWFDIKSDSRILEVGCGAGKLAPYFQEWTGVDTSKAAVKMARPYPTSLASADILPFKSSQFDLVFSVDILEHLCHPEPAISEWLRVCKPSGRVIISSPQLIHRVIFSKDWVMLESSQAVRNFKLVSSITFKVFVRSFVSITKKVLMRIRDEIDLVAGLRCPFRVNVPPLVLLTPEKKLQLNDLDALYAVNPHNICCYLKSRGHHVVNMKPLPSRLLKSATYENVIVIQKFGGS